MEIKTELSILNQSGVEGGTLEVIDNLFEQKCITEKKLHLFSVINLANYVSILFKEFNVPLEAVSSFMFEVSPGHPTEVYFYINPKDSLLVDDLVVENFASINNLLNPYTPKGFWLDSQLMHENIQNGSRYDFTLDKIDNHSHIEDFIIEKLLNKNLLSLLNKECLELELCDSKEDKNKVVKPKI